MSKTMTFRSLPIAALAVTLLPGCMTEPITGRSLAALIDEGSANQMGAQAFQQLMAEAPVGGSVQENALVERVGRRIAEATNQRMADEGRELYQWEFKVIDDPKMANAFALPGGKVAVYTGILPITQTEDGLAVVLGHEVAHAYAQHGRARVSQGIVAQVGLDVVQQALTGQGSAEVAQLAMAALGVGYQVGVALPFSRGDESAADEIGLHLMAAAGYDPSTAIDFWQRMEANAGGSPPEFLSTHPNPETRVEDIKRLLPTVMKVYESSKR